MALCIPFLDLDGHMFNAPDPVLKREEMVLLADQVIAFLRFLQSVVPGQRLGNIASLHLLPVLCCTGKQTRKVGSDKRQNGAGDLCSSRPAGCQ